MDWMDFPGIQTGLYIKTIRQLGTVARTMCGYCGNENAVTSDVWICFHCENANRATDLSIKLNDKDFVNTISEVNEHLSNNDYDGALAAYNNIVTKYKAPGITYNYGLLHLQYSNYEISLIRYDRKGFMEENAILREKASALVSKAKLLFNKAIAECADMAKAEGSNEFVAYTLLIINIKLKNLRAAMKNIEEIKTHNNIYLTDYSEMLFNAEAGRYIEAAKYAKELLKKGQFSPNACYYMGWALFKAGRHREAKELIGALGTQLQNNSMFALNLEIEKSMRIS